MWNACSEYILYCLVDLIKINVSLHVVTYISVLKKCLAARWVHIWLNV